MYTWYSPMLLLTGHSIGETIAGVLSVAAALPPAADCWAGNIYQAKNNLNKATVFAGMLMVIVINFAVEILVFCTIEVMTVHKCGMQL